MPIVTRLGDLRDRSLAGWVVSQPESGTSYWKHGGRKTTKRVAVKLQRLASSAEYCGIDTSSGDQAGGKRRSRLIAHNSQ